MKRISKHKVDLTDDEIAVWETKQELTKAGWSTARASIAALTSHGRPWTRDRYSDLFVAYLGEAQIEWPDRGKPPNLSPYGRTLAMTDRAT